MSTTCWNQTYLCNDLQARLHKAEPLCSSIMQLAEAWPGTHGPNFKPQNSRGSRKDTMPHLSPVQPYNPIKGINTCQAALMLWNASQREAKRLVVCVPAHIRRQQTGKGGGVHAHTPAHHS